MPKGNILLATSRRRGAKFLVLSLGCATGTRGADFEINGSPAKNPPRIQYGLNLQQVIRGTDINNPRGPINPPETD